ncbi:MAG: ribonuclease D [Sedimentisphaerales bacterium]|nr:ribonuclease D [Sedimentisphaerales bacterium]
MDILQINGTEVRVRYTDITEEEMTAALKANRVAWDIETSGLDWQSEKIGICQLLIPSKGVTVVRITEEKPVNLCSLLEEQSVMKLFHHAMFDLRFMAHNWCIVPQNIACTKIASKLLDKENNQDHSLISLLKSHLKIQITKAQRTSDWLSEKLTESQLSYAVKDVLYLFELFAKLEGKLKAKELMKLANSCFAHIPTRVKLDISGYKDIYTY